MQIVYVILILLQGAPKKMINHDFELKSVMEIGDPVFSLIFLKYLHILESILLWPDEPGSSF